MNTLYDFGIAVEQIRDAANSIDVKGANNVEALHTIFHICNDIISALNKIVEKHTLENPINQDGDGDGQVDS